MWISVCESINLLCYEGKIDQKNPTYASVVKTHLTRQTQRYGDKTFIVYVKIIFAIII